MKVGEASRLPVRVNHYPIYWPIWLISTRRFSALPPAGAFEAMRILRTVARHGLEARIREAQRSHLLEDSVFTAMRSLLAQRDVYRVAAGIVCVAVDLNRQLRVDGQSVLQFAQRWKAVREGLVGTARKVDVDGLMADHRARRRLPWRNPPSPRSRPAPRWCSAAPCAPKMNERIDGFLVGRNRDCP